MDSTAGNHRVLLIEDDEGIGGGLFQALIGEGYEPCWTRTVADTLRERVTDFDLILLDLGLPDGDGVDLCRRLRTLAPTSPIIILTARGAEADIVVGLDAGADDYLVKPFRLAELFARIRAGNRRRSTDEGSDAVLEVGDLRVEPAARRAYVGGAEVELRAKEFDLLVVLMRHAGEVLTRERAMELVWDEFWFGSTKTLDVHMASLRRRLGEPGPDDSRVTTVRGVGYRLEVGDEPR